MHISWRATYLNVRCTRQILRRRIGTMDIVIKRIYEEPSSDDGYRVLVDRLWRAESQKIRLILMNGRRT